VHQKDTISSHHSTHHTIIKPNNIGVFLNAAAKKCFLIASKYEAFNHEFGMKDLK
jgi:hypothetical protein